MADRNDNGIGIVGVAIIIILAGIALWYFLGSSHTTLPTSPKTQVETPVAPSHTGKTTTPP